MDGLLAQVQDRCVAIVLKAGREVVSNPSAFRRNSMGVAFTVLWPILEACGRHAVRHRLSAIMSDGGNPRADRLTCRVSAPVGALLPSTSTTGRLRNSMPPESGSAHPGGTVVRLLDASPARAGLGDPTQNAVPLEISGRFSGDESATFPLGLRPEEDLTWLPSGGSLIAFARTAKQLNLAASD